MPLASALRRAGIDLDSDCDQLWGFFAAQMRTERDKTSCRAIGHHLKEEFFVLCVFQMLTLSDDEMTSAIEINGGKKRWMRQLEALLGHHFRHLPANVPLSAHLVDNGSPEDSADGAAGSETYSSGIQPPPDQLPPSLPPSPPPVVARSRRRAEQRRMGRRA